MTDPGDDGRLARLAALERACFGPAAWSAAALAGELGRCFALFSEDGQGYVIGLPILDECELLRIGVHPDARRRGLGRALLDAFHAESVRRGVVRTLLEVRADNAAAIALYVSAAYELEGRRRAYYPARGEGSGPVDALLYGRRVRSRT